VGAPGRAPPCGVVSLPIASHAFTDGAAPSDATRLNPARRGGPAGPAGLRDGARLLIVHEQLGVLGGSERVLAAILDAYPAADLIAPRFDGGNLPEGMALPFAERSRVLDWGGRRMHFLTPLYERRMSSEALGDPIVVLTMTHTGWSLGAEIPAGVRHVCHAAGLPRAFYGHSSKYLLDYPALIRPALRAAVPLLRARYRRLIRKPDRLITISRYSAEHIEHETGRTATVVHPPVRTAFFTPRPEPREHVLVVARLVPHKRVDLAVEAFRFLDEQLVVVGAGSELESLQARAPANVHFTGYVSDEEVRGLMRRSSALVCPSVEEFGIVMAEALACGVPVVAPAQGGALEIVEDGTGILLERPDPESIAAAVRRLRAGPPDPARCRAAAERFDEQRFVTELAAVLDEELALALNHTPAPEQPGARPLATS
jgi:glycosyltransferase involved in cell wall biosynthesis